MFITVLEKDDKFFNLNINGKFYPFNDYTFNLINSNRLKVIRYIKQIKNRFYCFDYDGFHFVYVDELNKVHNPKDAIIKVNEMEDYCGMTKHDISSCYTLSKGAIIISGVSAEDKAVLYDIINNPPAPYFPQNNILKVLARYK